ncbi:MAG: hypothetical protein C0483_02995 [Pirellula sp.]|nr:hypothetical protein [Pirellula sp.]
MTKTHYRADRCLMCGSGKLDLALPMVPTPIGNDYLPGPKQPQECYSLTLLLCQDCGNGQIEDVVSPDLLFRSYTYSTSSSLGLREHFRSYAADMLGRVGKGSNDLAIDIGSNDGSLLRAFRDQGLRVQGVDPAIEIAKRATDEGLPTVGDFFTSKLARDLRERLGPARIVTANNVFAHSDQLPDMADGIRDLLADDGVFSFEVSYMVDTVGKMIFDTIYHEHLCYHSVRSLESFFRRHGLELFHVDRIATKGGSIRGSVQKAGGPRPKGAVVQSLIDLELSLGLDKPATYLAYGERIRAARDATHALISAVKKPEKKLAGYGASPTVTTLLYQFDLGEVLDFIVDDNPVKQNTHSPGQHIPTYSSERLYAEPADVLVLAWNYVQPIKQRHQRFSDNGGHFLVPLPLAYVA